MTHSTSAQLLIYERVEDLPAYDLHAVHLVPLQLDDYHHATRVQRPMPVFNDPAKNKNKDFQSQEHGRWSDDARRRYERYRKSWKKYRITKQVH